MAGEAGICERKCANRDGFDAVFAGFCAVFRRGERGCTCGDGFDAVFAGFCAVFRRDERGCLKQQSTKIK